MAEPAAKKARVDGEVEDVSEYFSDGLFASSSVEDYRTAYKASSPYKHAVIPELFDKNLLLSAREELLKLSFTEKETDIYKITQSGDFSNIHLLPEEEKKELPTLLSLRNKLYSAQFRRFLRDVTGCGPLSGVKTDMSTNNYGAGCHLLNHDDVIGTRRISFILYLPLPDPQWEPGYGGALELYPLSTPPTNPTTPACKPTVSIPPSFNQFAFFEVQPGHSFHSVEEVAFHPKVQLKNVPGGVGQRISISGWFHRPVPEEEEYEGEQPELTKSSLEQLYAAALRPMATYGGDGLKSVTEKLSQDETEELQQLVNPAYLDPTTIEQLQNSFLEDSHLLLTDFLKADVAQAIKEHTATRDSADGVERSKRVVRNDYGTSYRIPAHSTGEDEDWKLVGPPHIQRYVSLTGENAQGLFNRVNKLFASKAFRALLSLLTSSIPESHLIESRRFRPGLDYTLARGEPGTSETSRLDVGLNMTHSNDIWQSGSVGGWDVWLSSEEDSDEATYGAGDDDGPLLSLAPEFNRLHIVLRDPGLLHFVKYVSTRATNSRWDKWLHSALRVLSSLPSSSLDISMDNQQQQGWQQGDKALESPCLLHSYLDHCAATVTDFDKRTPHDNLQIAPNLVGSNNQVLGSIAGELENELEDEDEAAHERQNLTRQLAETAVGVREMSKQLGRARVRSKIKSVMIITKARDHQLIRHTRKLALYLMNTPRDDLKGQGMVVYVDSQLRTSKRFNVAGMRQDYPHLFTPRPQSRTTSQQDLKDLSMSFTSTSISPDGNKFLHPHNHQNNPTKDEGQLRFWTADMCTESPHLFDLVITLGGDGTVLFASWLFQTTVPPVLPFSLGSLGFLTNFDFTNSEKVINSIVDDGIRVNLRMRFTCTVYRSEYRQQDPKTEKARRPAFRRGETGEILMRNIEGKGWDALEGNTPPTNTKEGKKRDKEIMCFTTRPVETFNVLNDLVVDRGPSPYVSMLELFGDENHLTTVQADGLCVSTPTGSTAYSLSAGGSLVHPEIPALLISPICAHTLSFRPMLLPDSMELRICVPFNSRSTAWASFDGRGRVELKQGDHIKVTASKYPCPTICADKQSSDWFSSLGRTLHWNERARQKSFVVVEEGPKHAELKNEEAEKVEKGEDVDDGDNEQEDDDDDDDDDQFDIDEKSEAEGGEGASPGGGPGRARPILPKSFTSAFEPPVISGRGSPGRYATTTTQPKPNPVSMRHVYNPAEELRHRQGRSVSRERAQGKSRQPSLDSVNENPSYARLKQHWNAGDISTPPMSPATSARTFGVYGEDASESEMSD